MSTRRGTVKFLDDVLDDLSAFMHEVMRDHPSKYSQIEDPERAAEVLGVSALMVQDMSAKRSISYTFNMDRMTSLEGDTGPYLQYAHARLCSLTRNAGYSREEIESANLGVLTEPHAVMLVRLMARFPDTVNLALKTLEASTILTYLFKLTRQASSSYTVLKVIGASEGRDVSLARAALYEAARQVICNGMTLLGMTPLDR
jgi:arginyl-tRNA synthetase